MKNMQSKKNKKIDNKHGITLIALVVTMVAIFILAGVSIRLVTGDNGLIKKATDVRNQVEKEAENEEKEIEELKDNLLHIDSKIIRNNSLWEEAIEDLDE